MLRHLPLSIALMLAFGLFGGMSVLLDIRSFTLPMRLPLSSPPGGMQSLNWGEVP